MWCPFACCLNNDFCSNQSNPLHGDEHESRLVPDTETRQRGPVPTPSNGKSQSDSNQGSLRANIIGVVLAITCGLLFSLGGYCIKRFKLEFAELLIVRSVIQVK